MVQQIVRFGPKWAAIRPFHLTTSVLITIITKTHTEDARPSIRSKTDSHVQTTKLMRSDSIQHVKRLARERIVTTNTRIHFWTHVFLHVLFVPLRSMQTTKLSALVMNDVGKGPINVVLLKLARKAKR